MLVLESELFRGHGSLPQLLQQQRLALLEFLYLTLALVAHGLDARLVRRVRVLRGMLRALQRLL